MLLAYPALPATSKHDPHVPVPLMMYDLHRTMLWVKGLDCERFANPCELIQCSLLVTVWESVVRLHAYEAYAGIAAKPSRAALVSALRALDADGVFAAYRRCVEDADGLPEIAGEWAAIMRLCESA